VECIRRWGWRRPCGGGRCGGLYRGTVFLSHSLPLICSRGRGLHGIGWFEGEFHAVPKGGTGTVDGPAITLEAEGIGLGIDVAGEDNVKLRSAVDGKPHISAGLGDVELGGCWRVAGADQPPVAGQIARRRQQCRTQFKDHPDTDDKNGKYTEINRSCTIQGKGQKSLRRTIPYQPAGNMRMPKQ